MQIMVRSKHWKILCFPTFIFLFIFFENSIAQVTKVMIGDTAIIGSIIDTIYCGYGAAGVYCTHDNSTDFYFDLIDPKFGLNGVLIVFKPTRVGVQNDKFNLLVTWPPHNTCPPEHFTGPIAFTAEGIPFVKSVQVQVLSDVFRISTLVSNQIIQIILNFPVSQSASLQLFDALGRPQPLPVSQLQIPEGENSQKIDIGNIPSGWYMLRMKMKDEVINRSFIVVR